MEPTDEDLIRSYHEGSRTATEELIERHLNGVYTFLLLFVGTEEATDLTQETFLKAWKALSSYKAEKSAFKTWLMRIARNAAVDHMRKKRHVPFSTFEIDGENVLEESLRDEEPRADELFAKQEDATRIREALGKLPAPAREVLLLHYTNDMTFVEIAEALEQPVNTVKSRHRRALRALREILEANPESTELTV